MTEWICRWTPCWILNDDAFKKAYLEDWQLLKNGDNFNPIEDATQALPLAADSTRVRRSENKDGTVKHEQPLDTSSAPRSSWQAVGQPDAPTWNLSGTQGTSSFWENSEASLPHPKRGCNFVHPKQLSPFPQRLELPYPNGEILSGYEKDVSFIQDRFTTFVKADPNVTLERHMVDIRKAAAEYREAAVRGQESPAREYFFDSSVPNRSSVQKRLSIYNWNPGPRRGKEGAIENQIAGKWHIITLQEAIEYVDHKLLTNRFHVTHYEGCAVLFNKDTFFPDVKVKSIYLHDTRRDLPDKVMEGDSGRVLQDVLSRASFRRQPLIGQKTFTVLSLHICNVYAKKRGIGKKLTLTIRAVMLDENVDLVAGDFNGSAWRCSNRNNISTIEEAFCRLRHADASRPHTRVGTRTDSGQLGWRLWVPLNLLNPIGTGKYGFTVPFSIPHEALGIRPTDQSCTTKHGSNSTLSGGMTYSPNV